MGAFRVLLVWILILFAVLSLSVGAYGFYWAVFLSEGILERLRVALLGVIGLWAAAYLLSFAVAAAPESVLEKCLGVLGSNQATKWLLTIFYVLVLLASLLFFFSGHNILVLVALIVGGFILFATHEFLFGSSRRRQTEEALNLDIAFLVQMGRWDEVWRLVQPRLEADASLATDFAWWVISVGKESISTIEPLVEETLKNTPDAGQRGYLLFARGACQCHRGQIDQGTKSFAEAFDSMPDDNSKVVLCEHVANLVIMARITGLLAAADHYSLLAMEIQPEEITLKGTRGSIFIEMGRYAEGMDMLKEVFSGTHSENDKTICAFYLALASLRSGDPESVRQWREEMMRHNPPPWLTGRLGELEG